MRKLKRGILKAKMKKDGVQKINKNFRNYWHKAIGNKKKKKTKED